MSSASSRPGTGRETPPEFLIDRSLGRGFAAGLRACGWTITLINEVFPNDAQEVTDEHWIEYGCARGWAALTKDRWIRRRPQFEVATRPIFALSDGNLSTAEMVRRFDRHRSRIWEASASEHREFWVVYANQIVRRYPARAASG
jgi:hypothetical protein